MRDVASAKDLTDHLKWIKFSGISWKKDDWAWEKDYGSSENPEEFKALHAYSPLHNLKPGTRYPATLVSTADHDDRVAPAHSFKFAARLQKCQASDGPPVLIRIATSAGHGAGTALDKVIEKAADEISFLEANLK